MKKVSVIIPVYNAEKYLRESLDSVLNQTEKDIEVICVDDGSTDTSRKILEEYAKADARIKIIKGKHKGGGVARNLGMKKAEGEYLAFLDADDFMDETFLDKMYQKSKAENADITICGVKFLYQVTGALRDEVCGLREENLPDKEVFSYKDMKKYIFNSFHNWGWNKMFKRAFVEQHKLQYQEILRTNDLLFTCKALIEAARITTVKEHLITYRIDEEGDSCQRTNDVQLYGFYEAFLALKQYLIEKGVYEEVKQSFVNHALDGCIANLNTAEFSENHKMLYERLKNEIFAALDISDYDGQYYYQYNIDSKTLERYQQMMCGDYTSFLVYRAGELQTLFSNLQHDIYFTDRRVEGLVQELDASRNRAQGLQQEIVHMKIAVRDVSQHMEYVMNDNRAVYESFSYRFGHKVTSFPRWIFRKLTGK